MNNSQKSTPTYKPWQLALMFVVAIATVPFVLRACAMINKRPSSNYEIRSHEDTIAPALRAVQSEPKVLGAEWTNRSLTVEVADDGTRRDGFADYLCEVVSEHKGATPVTITVKDYRGGRVLGTSSCQ